MRRARKSLPARLLVVAAAVVAGAVVVARFELGEAPAPRPVHRADRAIVARRPAIPPIAVPAAPAPFPEPAQAAAAGPPAAPRSGRRILFQDEKPRAGSLAAIARAVVAEHRDELGLAAMPGELVVTREFASLSGWHLRYEQEVGGVPVFGSEVSAHVAADGRPLLVNADVFPVEGAATVPSVAAAAARAAAADLLSDDDGAPVESKPARLVILPDGRAGRLAWLVEARSGDESARVFIDAADGRPLRVDDLRHAADGTAEVFVPNPVYSLRDGSLRDNGNADSTALTAARVPVALHRLDGSGYLRGKWADITWTRSPSTSATLDWTSVTRGNAAFEQVMAYFHVDGAQQRLQDLGIADVNARSTQADAHAFKTDNSYYDGFDRALHFGDGGVDDAEDGDVIHHEYGHAMQDDQVPGFGLTEEGGAMGEGFGDFHAVSFHTAGDSVFDPLFASWDGTSLSFAFPPYVRRVDGSKVYPRDVDGEVHDDGEIWSRFLWDLRKLIGNDESLRLVVESQFLLTPSARFRDGANAVLAADRSLRAGADEAAIRALLDARGLPHDAAASGPRPDDSYEPNDDAAHAAPLDAGWHPGLVLADEDWFRLAVPPDRRLHVTPQFDVAQVALATEVRTTGGALVAASSDAGAAVDASAGPDGATLLLRVFDAYSLYSGAGYGLAVTEASLLALRSGHTKLLTIADGGFAVFSVNVGAGAVSRHAKLRVVAKSKWGGALADVRVVSPSGRIAATFGDGPTGTGSHVTVRVDEAGLWTVELRPRSGTSGTCAVKAKLD